MIRCRDSAWRVNRPTRFWVPVQGRRIRSVTRHWMTRRRIPVSLVLRWRVTTAWHTSVPVTFISAAPVRFNCGSTSTASLTRHYITTAAFPTPHWRRTRHSSGFPLLVVNTRWSRWCSRVCRLRVRASCSSSPSRITSRMSRRFSCKSHGYLRPVIMLHGMVIAGNMMYVLMLIFSETVCPIVF